MNHNGRIVKTPGSRKDAERSRGKLACPVIVNLTKHAPEDVSEHNESNEDFMIEDLPPAQRDELLELSAFNGETPPEAADIRQRAVKIATLAMYQGARFAWIGGAPYLMGPLEAELKKRGITPVYSWSRRDYMIVKDETDGAERLELYRRHEGWIRV